MIYLILKKSEAGFRWVKYLVNFHSVYIQMMNRLRIYFNQPSNRIINAVVSFFLSNPEVWLSRRQDWTIRIQTNLRISRNWSPELCLNSILESNGDSVWITCNGASYKHSCVSRACVKHISSRGEDKTFLPVVVTNCYVTLCGIFFKACQVCCILHYTTVPRHRYTTAVIHSALFWSRLATITITESNEYL